MIEEIWLAIKDYEGFYEISNLGRVRNYKTGRLLRLNKQKCGYIRVGLRKKGSKQIKYLVHRLVAQAFISNPYNKEEVNHLSGIRDQNNVGNLEWVTREENQQHSWKNLGRVSNAKGKTGQNNTLSMAVIKMDINGKFLCEYESMNDASKEGFSVNAIANCCRGIYKQHKGHKWKFKEFELVCA